MYWAPIYIVKRVSLDFHWAPLLLWKGYSCPYKSEPCICYQGYSPDAAKLAAKLVLRSHFSPEELEDLKAPNGLYFAPEFEGKTPEEINAFLNPTNIERAVWYVIRSRFHRENREWKCKYCEGYGKIWHSPQIRQLALEWEKVEPPKGEGWQVWQIAKCPISPVFATPQELAKWLVDNSIIWGCTLEECLETVIRLGNDQS